MKALEMGLSLTDWLEATQERRDELDAFGRSPMPIDATERGGETNKLLKNEDDAARLLADAESFLSQAEGIAVKTVRDKFPDYTADERKKKAKEDVRDIQRLVAGLGITLKTISNRRFLAMNANRSRM